LPDSTQCGFLDPDLPAATAILFKEQLLRAVASPIPSCLDSAFLCRFRDV
jgi:hypothetical protein